MEAIAKFNRFLNFKAPIDEILENIFELDIFYKKVCAKMSKNKDKACRKLYP